MVVLLAAHERGKQQGGRGGGLERRGAATTTREQQGIPSAGNQTSPLPRDPTADCRTTADRGVIPPADRSPFPLTTAVFFVMGAGGGELRHGSTEISPHPNQPRPHTHILSRHRATMTPYFAIFLFFSFLFFSYFSSGFLGVSLLRVFPASFRFGVLCAGWSRVVTYLHYISFVSFLVGVFFPVFPLCVFESGVPGEGGGRFVRSSVPLYYTVTVLLAGGFPFPFRVRIGCIYISAFPAFLCLRRS